MSYGYFYRVLNNVFIHSFVHSPFPPLGKMSILGNVHFVESVSKLIEERGRGGARKARNGEEIACSQAGQVRESCTEGFQLQSTIRFNKSALDMDGDTS